VVVSEISSRIWWTVAIERFSVAVGHGNLLVRGQASIKTEHTEDVRVNSVVVFLA